MKTHELKTWPIFFAPLKQGIKTFELRKNDRDFRAGDVLLLREWCPRNKKYTGDCLVRLVKHIMHAPAFGLKAGYVIMSIEPTSNFGDDE